MIKKSLLEDLQSQRTTYQRSIVSPLHKPCLSHILEMISGQIGLLTLGQPYIKMHLIEIIDIFLGVFLNLRPVESKRVHSSEVPYMESHSGDLLMRMGYKIPVSLGHHSLGLNSRGLSIFDEASPYISICQGWRINRILSILPSSSIGEICSPWGGALALAILSSSLRSVFLRVLILPIRTTIRLDAKETISIL